MSEFTLKDGKKLFYRDIGSGDITVIMMHGWTSDSSMYRVTAELLKDKARFIIYDHRGHSGSKDAGGADVTMETLASDLNEIITGLGLTNIILLGWSMGAGVAMNYVKMFGCSAIRHLVLCDMTPKQLSDSEWKLGLDKGTYTKEKMEADKERDFLSLYKDFSIAAAPKYKRVPGFLFKKGLKKKLEDCDITTLTALSQSMKLQDNRDFIEKVDVPLTYFYADPGSIFLPELEKWYRENCKTEFESVRFEGTHLFISDDPDTFTNKVSLLIENERDTMLGLI